MYAFIYIRIKTNKFTYIIYIYKYKFRNIKKKMCNIVFLNTCKETKKCIYYQQLQHSSWQLRELGHSLPMIAPDPTSIL